MQGNVYSIRAIVKIQSPPEYIQGLGWKAGQMWGFDTANQTGPGGDLESLVIMKNMHEPAGRFTMTFAPRQPVKGYFWSDLIPSYALVEIYTQRFPDDQQPVLRMLGLTGARGTSQEYGRAQPQRMVQISGSELSSIFAEQKILYLPVPPQQQMEPDEADVIWPDARDEKGRPLATAPVMMGRSVAMQGLQQEGPPASGHLLPLLGMLAIDPMLAIQGESPVDAIDHFVQMMTTGFKTQYNPNGIPLVNFQFPDAELKNLVFFNAAEAKAKLFDPRAELPASSQLTYNSSLWNLMTAWCDPAYQELFAVTRDLSALPDPRNPGQQLGLSMSSPSAVEIVFRKKPFAGFIDGTGKLQGVAKPTGTQFDANFVGDGGNTVTVDGSDIQTESVFQSPERAKNIYLVVPVVPGMDEPHSFEALAVPLGDNEGTSPSRISRYGPRLMKVADYYLRWGEGPQAKANAPDPFALARQRQRLLRAWHRFEPLFYHGSLRLKGNAHVQVGNRLVDRRADGRRREYYVTGWTDSMTFGRDVGYMTTVQVERGWDLNTSAL